MTEDRNTRPEPVSRSLNTCRPDAAWIANASHRDFRSALTDEERKTRRDWGLYVMIFYGFVAVTFGGFAVYAVSQDGGRPNVLAKRTAPARDPSTMFLERSAGNVSQRSEK